MSFNIWEEVRRVLSVGFCWLLTSLARILGERSTIDSPPALFCLKKKKKMEISSCTLIPLFRPRSVHSGSASWDDCGRECSPTSCVWARFLIGSKTVPGQRHSQLTPNFVRSRLYAWLGVTYHLHFRQNDRGLLRATAVTRGWNGHRIGVSTES